MSEINKTRVLIHLFTGIFSGCVYFYVFKIPSIEITSDLTHHAIAGSIVGFVYFWYVFSVSSHNLYCGAIRLLYYSLISMGGAIMFLELMHRRTTLVSVYLIFISISGILCMLVKRIVSSYNKYSG